MLKPRRRINCVDLTSTLRCNWKCKYCDVIGIKEGPFDPDVSLLEPYTALATKMVTGASVAVTGGEPGLALDDVWDWIERICVDAGVVTCTTNGAAFDRGLHEKYDFVDHWRIHGSAHLEETGPIKHKAYKDTAYVYVVDRNSIDVFPEVVKMNPDIPILGNFLIPKIENPELIPTVEQAKRAYDELKGAKNLDPKSLKELKLFISISDGLNVDELRQSCSVYPVNPILNLPKMRIHRCCLSISSDSVPFSVDAFERAMNVEDQYVSWDKDTVCAYCHKAEKLLTNSVAKLSCAQ